MLAPGTKATRETNAARLGGTTGSPIGSPVATLQITTEPSRLAVAIMLPSGLGFASSSGPPWPRRVSRDAPSAASQTRANSSPEAVSTARSEPNSIE